MGSTAAALNALAEPPHYDSSPVSASLCTAKRSVPAQARDIALFCFLSFIELISISLNASWSAVKYCANTSRVLKAQTNKLIVYMRQQVRRNLRSQMYAVRVQRCLV